jgi:uncharacterized membrane protein
MTFPSDEFSPMRPLTEPSGSSEGEPADGIAKAPPPPTQRFLWGAAATLIVGYAALSHYSNSVPDAKGLGAALSLGPVLLIGAVLLWRSTRPAVALLGTGLVGVCVYHFWGSIERNYELADLVQQCGVYGLVALSFARTLFSGRVPMCTQLANTMHGELTPLEIAYTRRATVAWAVFYLFVTAAILIVFLAAPLRVWSLFVNFGTIVLIVSMGIADHAIRRRLLPRHPGGGLLAIIRRSLIG